MNQLEPSVEFIIKTQTYNKLPFLGVMVQRRNSQLTTGVYRKPIDTGLYLKWSGNQPRNYKINLIKCLCTRAKRICSYDILFEQELEYCKNIFITQGYPINVVKKMICSMELNTSTKRSSENTKDCRLNSLLRIMFHDTSQ